MIGGGICRVTKDLFLAADGKVELGAIKHGVSPHGGLLAGSRPCQRPIWNAIAQTHVDIPSMTARRFILDIERWWNVDRTETDIVSVGCHEFYREFTF